MSRIKPYIKTLFVAACIFVLDAVILNQGFVAVILILLALFVFSPFAVLLRRRDRRKYEQRLVRRSPFMCSPVSLCLAPTRYRIGWPTAVRSPLAMRVSLIARNTISIQRPLKNWCQNSCLPFLPQNGENISSIRGRWSRILSRCCGMPRCRPSGDVSITWSLEGGDISIDFIGLVGPRQARTGRQSFV